MGSGPPVADARLWSVMFTVYVIKDVLGSKYTGCSNNLSERLNEHKGKLTKTTRKGDGWEVVYTREFVSRTEALRFEKMLKTGRGREMIRDLVGE